MNKRSESFPPSYQDRNGSEIKAGMRLRMEDGSVEMVYETTDGYGNPDLGINASNEAFLEKHPEWAREYYSLSAVNTHAAEICSETQKIHDGLQGMPEASSKTRHRDRGDAR